LDDTAPLKHFKRGLEALVRDDFSNCIVCLRSGIELNLDNAPLNVDMKLLLERVLEEFERLAAAKQATNPLSATSDDSEVRTDFSLYGGVKN
jgi:hypothetical protein